MTSKQFALLKVVRALSGTCVDATEKQAACDTEVRGMLARTPEMTTDERDRQRESLSRGNVAACEPIARKHTRDG